MRRTSGASFCEASAGAIDDSGAAWLSYPDRDERARSPFRKKGGVRARGMEGPRGCAQGQAGGETEELLTVLVASSAGRAEGWRLRRDESVRMRDTADAEGPARTLALPALSLPSRPSLAGAGCSRASSTARAGADTPMPACAPAAGGARGVQGAGGSPTPTGPEPMGGPVGVGKLWRWRPRGGRAGRWRRSGAARWHAEVVAHALDHRRAAPGITARSPARRRSHEPLRVPVDDERRHADAVQFLCPVT